MNVSTRKPGAERVLTRLLDKRMSGIKFALNLLVVSDAYQCELLQVGYHFSYCLAARHLPIKCLQIFAISENILNVLNENFSVSDKKTRLELLFRTKIGQGS